MKIFDFGGEIIGVGFIKSVGSEFLGTKVVYKVGGDNGEGRKLLVEVYEGVKEPGAVAPPGYKEGEAVIGKMFEANRVLVGVVHPAHYTVGGCALGGYLGRNGSRGGEVGLGKVKFALAVAILGGEG